MPVRSFSIADLIPELVAGLITYVPDVYQETFGLSGMAVERPPQLEPKIRVMGKVYIRPVAADIPEASEATLIKDTKFTDDEFTAPEYGKGFSIKANDLIQNQAYDVNFKSMRVATDQAPRLIERTQNASNMCIEMIKRAADSHIQQLLKTGTLQFTNYTTIDFGRDASNSETITGAIFKWTIANASTMKPYQDMDRWCEQVADRGNCGNDEFYIIMSRTAYKAYVNSDDYKADSDIRRNYRVERLSGISSDININVPNGAVYRESIMKGAVGIYHIFTYNQTFTNSSGNPEQWITDEYVFVIASSNVFQRQPVEILTMNDLIAQSTMLRSLLRAVPSMQGWLIQPEWNKITARAFVMGIYRKFITQMLTPNKTYAALVNS